MHISILEFLQYIDIHVMYDTQQIMIILYTIKVKSQLSLTSEHTVPSIADSYTVTNAGVNSKEKITQVLIVSSSGLESLTQMRPYWIIL